MISFYKKYKNVKDFEVSSNISFITDQEIYFLDLKYDVSRIIKVDFTTKLQIIKNDFFLSVIDNYGKTFVIDENHNSLEYNFFLLKQISETEIFISKDQSIHLYDLSKNIFKKTIPVKSLTSYFDSEMCFLKISQRRSIPDSFACYNIIDERQHWIIDLNTIASKFKKSTSLNLPNKITKIIGRHAENIWISINHHMILAFDINDGSITFNISEIPSFKSDWLPSSIPLPEATILDTKNNILIGFAWEFYWEIDAITGKVTFLDLTNYFKELTIRNDLNHFVLSKTHIFFASRNGKLGALNRITFKVDWVHNFEKNASGEIPIITEVKGNEQYLGALDLGGTLHIFEKENIS